MSDCEKLRPLLSQLLDGTLDEAQRAELAGHLAGCESCSRYYSELEQMHRAFSALPAAEPPADLSERVMQEIRREKIQKKKRRSRFAGLAACAALVFVTAGAFLPQWQTGSKCEECAETENPEVPAAIEYKSADAQNASADSASAAAPQEQNPVLYSEQETELPRSVVTLYDAPRDDYLKEYAVSFSHDADGACAGYDLPKERLKELEALCEEDGVEIELSVAPGAETFLVQYREAAHD